MDNALSRAVFSPRVKRTQDEIKNIKVADLQFAFNNSELIKKLRERGGHIAGLKFDKMRETET